MSWAARLREAQAAPPSEDSATTAVFVGGGGNSATVPTREALPPAVDPEDSAAETPTPQPTLEITDVVLDAGAIISGEMARRAKPGVRYHTVPEVLAEIKDAQSKSALQAFPYKIRVTQVFEESVDFVRKFSSLTGDLRQLSPPDLMILALGYQLEHQALGMANLRGKPPSVSQDQLHSAIKQQQADREKEDKLNLPEDSQQPESEESAPSAVDEAVQGHQLAEDGQALPSVDKEDGKNGNEGFDDKGGLGGDDDGAWITPDNIDEVDPDSTFKGKKGGPLSEDSSSVFKKTSPIAVSTTDFTMQNVMLQMGLRLLSVNGKEISGVRRWILKCFCCDRTETDMELEFCDWCGHHTLARAVVVVQADGTIRIYENNRYIYNLRGTKYPIPMPKGGRRNKDLKFAPDMMNDRRLHSHKKNRQDESFFQMGSDFAISKSKGSMDGDVFGYGRRNPNHRRKGTGNRKRGRRNK